MFDFNLQKQIHDQLLIQVRFEVKSGTITTLIGKSGAGKSSILNLISGIISLDQGWVRSSHEDFTKIPVHLRNFGYIQQQSYLFKHLTLMENLTYSGYQEGLESYLDIFELGPHLQKRVDQLSGGEAQRVSIVRTLMSQPQLLLIDEGLSALDSKLRSKLKNYLKQLDLPIVFITHDLDEAYELSDHILVIEDGKIVEQGSCKAIFHHCQKIQTANLIGIENIYHSASVKKAAFFEYLSKSQWIGIKGNQISLEKEGVPATVQSMTGRLDEVVLELNVRGLDEPLIAVLSWREYEPWQGKPTVYIKINHIIYLEDSQS